MQRCHWYWSWLWLNQQRQDIILWLPSLHAVISLLYVLCLCYVCCVYQTLQRSSVFTGAPFTLIPLPEHSSPSPWSSTHDSLHVSPACQPFRNLVWSLNPVWILFETHIKLCETRELIVKLWSLIPTLIYVSCVRLPWALSTVHYPQCSLAC